MAGLEAMSATAFAIFAVSLFKTLQTLKMKSGCCEMFATPAFVWEPKKVGVANILQHPLFIYKVQKPVLPNVGNTCFQSSRVKSGCYNHFATPAFHLSGLSWI